MNVLHDTPTHNEIPKKDNDDFVLSGMFVTFGLLAIVGLLVYLLTVQTNAQKCEPIYGEDGAVTNNCPPQNVTPQPSGVGVPGGIEFLDNFNDTNRIPELDGVE